MSVFCFLVSIVGLSSPKSAVNVSESFIYWGEFFIHVEKVNMDHQILKLLEKCVNLSSESVPAKHAV
jgi:hypothetical protein